jgi:hypothetical protein
LDAARDLMLALYNQFSIPAIQSEVFELSTSDDGLEKCYAFLKLKEYNSSRRSILSFRSVKQTNFVYDAERNEKSESFILDQVISLYQDGNDFDLEITNPATNRKSRTNSLKPGLEAHGFICYSNSDVSVQLNRKDPFFDNAIISVSIIDKKQRWLIEFEG